MLATECSNPHAMRAVVGKTVERIAITDHHVTEDPRARAETASGSASRQNSSGPVVQKSAVSKGPRTDEAIRKVKWPN